LPASNCGCQKYGWFGSLPITKSFTCGKVRATRCRNSENWAGAEGEEVRSFLPTGVTANMIRTPAVCAWGIHDWISSCPGITSGRVGSQVTETRFTVRPTSAIVAKNAAPPSADFPASSVTPTASPPCAAPVSVTATEAQSNRPESFLTNVLL
jgi:hypothetical protein